MNKTEDLMEFVEDRPGHDFRYSMNSNKISEKFRWKRNSDFEEGLEKTIRWYLDNPKILSSLSASTLKSTPWKN